MALAHFVAMKMGQYMSLFVDGEQVYMFECPSVDEFKKSFKIFFPTICSSEVEFAKNEDGIKIFINGKAGDFPVNCTTETFEEEVFLLESLAHIKLPILFNSDEDLAELLDNGNLTPAIHLLNDLGFPLMSEKIRSLTKKS